MTQTLLTDVELFWLKVDPNSPVSPFGAPQWEAQVRVPKKRKKELEPLVSNPDKNIKDQDNNMVSVNFKKKAVNAKGEKMQPVRVVDANKKPIENLSTIGNGSTGNVIIRSYDYDVAGRKGTAYALDAIQIIKLVEYTGGDSLDFDVVEGHDDSLF